MGGVLTMQRLGSIEFIVPDQGVQCRITAITAVLVATLNATICKTD